MSRTRMRLATASLVPTGVLFLLYPALRPWEDETTADGAVEALSSAAWVASHLFAMVGFILVPIGLLSLGAAAVLSAVAVARSGVLPRYSGIPFALGFALFIPQFLAPAAVRIGHGALVAAGSIVLATVVWRAESTAQRHAAV